MDARTIIFNYFNYIICSPAEDDLTSLMDYLDTDTLVGWFVDEGYVDNLDDENETEVVMNHYELHCGR